MFATLGQAWRRSAPKVAARHWAGARKGQPRRRATRERAIVPATWTITVDAAMPATPQGRIRTKLSAKLATPPAARNQKFGRASPSATSAAFTVATSRKAAAPPKRTAAKSCANRKTSPSAPCAANRYGAPQSPSSVRRPPTATAKATACVQVNLASSVSPAPNCRAIRAVAACERPEEKAISTKNSGAAKEIATTGEAPSRAAHQRSIGA